MEVVILTTFIVLVLMFLIRHLDFFGLIGLVMLLLVRTFLYQEAELKVEHAQQTNNK